VLTWYLRVPNLTQKNPQGGIVKQEAPIHISNLNPVENGKPVRVGRVEKDGKLVRVSKKTGKEI
jgi:large subunit ribosomal protein L24